MTCHNCRTECKRNGKHKNGQQRFKCGQCGKRFTAPHENPLEGMYTSTDKAEQDSDDTEQEIVSGHCGLRYWTGFKSVRICSRNSGFSV